MKIRFKKFTSIALTGLSLAATTYLFTSLTSIAPKVNALPSSSIAKNDSNLLGIWRATDESVKEIFAEVGEPSGDVLLIFDNTTEARFVYQDFSLEQEGVPPTNFKGGASYTWKIPIAQSLELSSQSYDLEAEVLGISVPVPNNLPKATTVFGYEIEGNTLRLRNNSEDFKFPQVWEKR